MKSTVFFLAVTLLVSTSMATPPMRPAPLAETIREFKASDLAKIEGLCTAVLQRLPASPGKAVAEKREDVRVILMSLKEDHFPRLEQAVTGTEKTKVFDEAEIVGMSLGELRRSVDGLVVEVAAENRLPMEKEFLEALRTFWTIERHYWLRFSKARAEAVFLENGKRGAGR